MIGRETAASLVTGRDQIADEIIALGILCVVQAFADKCWIGTVHFGYAVGRKDKEISDLAVIFARTGQLVELADRVFLTEKTSINLVLIGLRD